MVSKATRQVLRQILLSIIVWKCFIWTSSEKSLVMATANLSLSESKGINDIQFPNMDLIRNMHSRPHYGEGIRLLKREKSKIDDIEINLSQDNFHTISKNENKKRTTIGVDGENVGEEEPTNEDDSVNTEEENEEQGSSDDDTDENKDEFENEREDDTIKEDDTIPGTETEIEEEDEAIPDSGIEEEEEVKEEEEVDTGISTENMVNNDENDQVEEEEEGEDHDLNEDEEDEADKDPESEAEDQEDSNEYEKQDDDNAMKSKGGDKSLIRESVGESLPVSEDEKVDHDNEDEVDKDSLPESSNDIGNPVLVSKTPNGEVGVEKEAKDVSEDENEEENALKDDITLSTSDEKQNDVPNDREKKPKEKVTIVKQAKNNTVTTLDDKKLTSKKKKGKTEKSKTSGDIRNEVTDGNSTDTVGNGTSTLSQISPEDNSSSKEDNQEITQTSAVSNSKESTKSNKNKVKVDQVVADENVENSPAKGEKDKVNAEPAVAGEENAPTPLETKKKTSQIVKGETKKKKKTSQIVKGDNEKESDESSEDTSDKLQEPREEDTDPSSSLKVTPQGNGNEGSLKNDTKDIVSTPAVTPLTVANSHTEVVPTAPLEDNKIDAKSPVDTPVEIKEQYPVDSPINIDVGTPSSSQDIPPARIVDTNHKDESLNALPTDMTSPVDIPEKNLQVPVETPEENNMNDLQAPAGIPSVSNAAPPVDTGIDDDHKTESLVNPENDVKSPVGIPNESTAQLPVGTPEESNTNDLQFPVATPSTSKDASPVQPAETDIEDDHSGMSTSALLLLVGFCVLVGCFVIRRRKDFEKGNSVMNGFAQKSQYQILTKDDTDDEEWGWSDNSSSFPKVDGPIAGSGQQSPSLTHRHLVSADNAVTSVSKLERSSSARSRSSRSSTNSVNTLNSRDPLPPKQVQTKIPPPPDPDDFFEQMGLSAKPKFAKGSTLSSKQGVSTSTVLKSGSVPSTKNKHTLGATILSTNSDDGLDVADWGDDGDLDDLLKG